MELSKVRKLALELIKENGANCWFTFSDTKGHLGDYNSKENTIRISKEYAQLNTIKEVKDTLLHEIAHSLTRGHGHDRVFKQLCKELGCSGSSYKKEDYIKPEKKYIYTCSTCGHILQRQVVDYTIACSRCCDNYAKGKYDIKYRFNIIKNPNYESK